MRKRASIWFLAAAFLICGCDPGGLRRVQLQLHNPIRDNTSINLESADTKEALQIIDEVVLKHGFQPTESEPGYIKVYSLNSARIIHCRVRPTSIGIEVTFGDPGLLGGKDKEERLFVYVRDALTKRFGRKNVKSHRLGVA